MCYQLENCHGIGKQTGGECHCFYCDQAIHETIAKDDICRIHGALRILYS